MHVGFDITPLAGQRTGVGNYCHALLGQLLRRDECRLTGFAASLPAPCVDGLGGPLAYRRIPVPTRALYKSWEWFNWPPIDSLVPGIDVYHATNYFMPPARRARRVVTFYDLAFIKHPEWSSPKISGLFARQVARFAAESDAVIVCSESTRADTVELLGADPARVFVAYGAVDADFAAIERAAAAELLERKYGVRGPFLLFVGTLEPRKNVPALVKAFAQLAREIPHSLVLAGGTGWDSEGIFRTIDASGVGDRIIRTGYITPHRELAAFYSAADVFVFPTLYEGFGLPLVESMTCGCPVVASNNSSAPEVAGSAALYVDPEDPASIGAGVRRAIEDSSLRSGMVARGLVQAGKFTWDECARVTLDVYRRVTS